MALWSVRQTEQTRSGLTIYQVQELIRTGRVTLDAEVSTDGKTWRRARELPSLARAQPEAPTPESNAVSMGGLVLERGPDGKLLPPSPAAIDEYLAKHRTRVAEKTGPSSGTKMTLAAVSIVVIVACMVALYQLLSSNSFAR